MTNFNSEFAELENTNQIQDSTFYLNEVKESTEDISQTQRCTEPIVHIPHSHTQHTCCSLHTHKCVRVYHSQKSLFKSCIKSIKKDYKILIMIFGLLMFLISIILACYYLALYKRPKPETGPKERNYYFITNPTTDNGETIPFKPLNFSLKILNQLSHFGITNILIAESAMDHSESATLEDLCILKQHAKQMEIEIAVLLDSQFAVRCDNWMYPNRHIFMDTVDLNRFTNKDICFLREDNVIFNEYQRYRADEYRRIGIKDIFFFQNPYILDNNGPADIKLTDDINMDVLKERIEILQSVSPKSKFYFFAKNQNEYLNLSPSFPTLSGGILELGSMEFGSLQTNPILFNEIFGQDPNSQRKFLRFNMPVYHNNHEEIMRYMSIILFSPNPIIFNGGDEAKDGSILHAFSEDQTHLTTQEINLMETYRNITQFRLQEKQTTSPLSLLHVDIHQNVLVAIRGEINGNKIHNLLLLVINHTPDPVEMDIKTLPHLNHAKKACFIFTTTRGFNPQQCQHDHMIEFESKTISVVKIM